MDGVSNKYLEARVSVMDRPKDEMHDKEKRHVLDLECFSFTLEAYVDEAIKLVKMELLPNLRKYIESSNSR